MEFLTFSEKEMRSRSYSAITTPHLLISISNIGERSTVPASPYCKAKLEVQFNDVEDIGETSFDHGIARDIITFANKYANVTNLIIVHCGAGVSRSVAVAAALSKIINYVDDNVYTKGLPNMLVYLTILDTYFMNKQLDKDWPKLQYLRTENMKLQVTPALQRMYIYRVDKRSKEKE